MTSVLHVRENLLDANRRAIRTVKEWQRPIEEKMILVATGYVAAQTNTFEDLFADAEKIGPVAQLLVGIGETAAHNGEGALWGVMVDFFPDNQTQFIQTVRSAMEMAVEAGNAPPQVLRGGPIGSEAQD